MATFTAGMKPLASLFEAEVSAMSTYTPTWTAAGTPAIGNGSLAGYYLQVGKMVDFKIGLVIGTTTTSGTAGNQWTFSLPVAARYPGAAPWNNAYYIGKAYINQTGTALYEGDLALTTSGSTISIAWRQMPVGVFATVNNGSPFTPASTHVYMMTGRYEAA